MTRRSMRMGFIVNASEIKNTYKKRKQSILKKTEELSTLCGIEACTIICSPYDAEPQIWPSDDSSVRNVLERFRSLSEWQQCKHMVNKQSYTAEIIAKKRGQVRKLEKSNKKEELCLFMFHCIGAARVQPENNMSVDDLNNLSEIIEKKLNDISRKMENLSVNEVIPHQPQIQTESHQQTLQEYQSYQSQIQTQPYPTPMVNIAFQPLFEIPAYQPMMEASSSSQAQLQTQPNQALTQTQAYQPPIQTQPFQTLMQIPYQPQLQIQSYQTLMQGPASKETPSYETQLQAPAYQPQMATTSYQAQLGTSVFQQKMPTPALGAANTEEMTQLNDGNASNMDPNNMQNQWLMDMLNDNEFDPMMPPFGEVNLPL